MPESAPISPASSLWDRFPSLSSSGTSEREEWISIPEADNLPPFLVSIVSRDDHWLFVASNGGLSAGRVSPNQALFPYYTQDKLIDLAGSTGPLTYVAWDEGGKRHTWRPFDPSRRSATRRISKRLDGTALCFEEFNPEADLLFRYEWACSARFGFVRTATLHHAGGAPRRVEVLDGVQNLMPSGVTAAFQNEFSNLVDAYKRVEQLPGSRLCLVYLSSIPTDRAEPSEALRSTSVWTCGLGASTRVLTTRQVNAFLKGEDLSREDEARGLRAACLEQVSLELAPGESRTWHLVAEVAQSTAQVSHLEHYLAGQDDEALTATLEDDLARNRDGLRAIVASGDGLQLSAQLRRTSRHASNVLFNLMRGGVFPHHYELQRAAFETHLRHFNHALAQRHEAWLSELPEVFSREELEELAEATGDPDLQRLASEYLPLTFSRRHGDPSRPWNRFEIRLRGPGGEPRFAYQGNWRDIFQNWEALLHAFPAFAEGAILRFLNASTADGHNPYRLTHDGFEWETIDPDEPWSNIGYWGDHQLIYLLRLLETARRFHPGQLERFFERRIFTYARVPYRIRSYDAMLEDPRATVDYDHEAEAEIEGEVKRRGADGRLLLGPDGDIRHVALLEKLLVPLLAKLSSFVPDGGIWMNTQRPEWNDANNALVGFGVSVVTLAHAHRYVAFLQRWLEACPTVESHEVSVEVAAWMEAQEAVFSSPPPQAVLAPNEREAFVRALGESASSYREKLYRTGLSGEARPVGKDALKRFLGLAQAWIRQSLVHNRRPDGLYHSYNLLVWPTEGGVRIETLPEMLEGQVAILSADLLEPAEALEVTRALRHSRLWREDQQSYLLYPNRALPGFLEKNRLDPAWAEASELVQALASDPAAHIVERDAEGQLRFTGDFRNAGDLRDALEALPASWKGLLAAEGARLVSHFEDVFNHRAYTGRSGTFFAYEGLGSIYWHMVSKLLLAVQENLLACAEDPDARETAAALADFYTETLAGLGIEKSPEQYGAFPTDAYSHTPAHAGAQQPGMTGQVKEDILIRWGELGLAVEDGCLVFRPRLLSEGELLTEPGHFRYLDLAGEEQTVPVPAGAMAFTFCQVPILYRRGERFALKIHRAETAAKEIEGPLLPIEFSHDLFHRRGSVQMIEVELPPNAFREHYFIG